MPDCPVCGDDHDRYEVVSSVEVRPGDDPDGTRLCVAGYTQRDGSPAVRCYYHDEG